MMIVTVYKLDKDGYRKKSHDVLRAKSVRISNEDCDVIYITLWNGVEWKVNMNKYDVEVELRTFP